MTPDELILKNRGLVYHYANKFRPSLSMLRCDYEDLVSIGMLGMVKAAKTFDASKGIQFATYASTCIMNQLRMALRQTRHGLVDSLNRMVGDDNIEMQEFIVDEVDITAGVERECEVTEMYEALSRLPQREQQLIKLRYGIGHLNRLKQKELAQLFGISQSYVSRLERRAVKKLREII